MRDVELYRALLGLTAPWTGAGVNVARASLDGFWATRGHASAGLLAVQAEAVEDLLGCDLTLGLRVVALLLERGVELEGGHEERTGLADGLESRAVLGCLSPILLHAPSTLPRRDGCPVRDRPVGASQERTRGC